MTDGARRSWGSRLVSTSAAFFRIDVIEEFNYPATMVMAMLAVVVPLVPFFFISDLVGDSPVVGGDYLTFTVIGLAMSAVMTGAMSGFGGTLQNAFQRGTLESFLIEPVSWTLLPLAMNQWQVMFGVVSGLLVFGVGILLGANLVLAGVPAAIVLGVLGLISSTAIGIISAAVLLLTLKSAPVLRLYALAASLLAGSVFSVSQLPGWAKALAALLPHTYVINGVRSALMEDPGTFDMPIGTAVIALSLFDLVFLPLGLVLFKRTLEFSRKMGSLSGY
jgi:ABC-2 type transport system permease protein